MTQVLYEPREFHLRVTGHARAAEDTDPVCAGVSALAFTLIEAATTRQEYNTRLLIEEQTPAIDVRCSPERLARKSCRYMFEIIMGGLMLIAEAHPENVQIKIGG